MTRFVRPSAPAVVTFFFAAMCMLISTSLFAAQQQQQQQQSFLAGRLATVEPANRRITMLPDGEIKTIEMFVADDGAVVQDDRSMTLSDLVIQVGRRVTVHFRVDGERRIAERIIVDPA